MTPLTLLPALTLLAGLLFVALTSIHAALAQGEPGPVKITIGGLARDPKPSPTATPPPTPTPKPTPPGTRAFIVGSDVPVYREPTDASARIGTMWGGQEVRVKGPVAGPRWIIANQTWYIEYQPWQDTWYELVSGGYVYAAWVFLPREGEILPWELAPRTIEVHVDTSTQTLGVWYGDRLVYIAGVTTGKPGYETPLGRWQIEWWGRIENEIMDSTPFNYPRAEQYRVENVLFTQYFTGEGHALHLNYWRPPDWFGEVASSHGCVGLYLHDAQWLWFAGYVGMPVVIE